MGGESNMRKQSISRWIIRCFIVILVLSMLTSAAGNLYEVYNTTMKENAVRAESCAGIVTGLLGHQMNFNSVNHLTDTQRLFSLRKSLLGICRGFGMDYLYIYTVDPETGARQYTICVSSDAAKDRVLQEASSVKPLSGLGMTPEESALLNGETEIQRVFLHNELGNEIAWIAPYINKKGEQEALIGMNYSLTEANRSILISFLRNIIPFLLSLSVGFMLLLVMVRRRIILPINVISESMKRFARDTQQKPESLRLPYRDEIGEIAASYEKMTGDIIENYEHIEALTRERVEANVQLELARRIQYGMVPEHMTMKGDGFSVNALTRPAKAVGGDFYDCFQRKDGTVCVFIGDVSGKGITAALFMAMIKTMIRQKLMAGLSPAETLNQTNNEIFAQNPENLFASAFAATMNPLTGELHYANAGHTSPVLLKDNPEFLRAKYGIFLGLYQGDAIVNETLFLPASQGILLYTDGVTEAVNPQRDFFEEDRLLDAVRGLPGGNNAAEESILRVSRAVSDFRGESEPFDDMALLALIRVAP